MPFKTKEYLTADSTAKAAIGHFSLTWVCIANHSLVCLPTMPKPFVWHPHDIHTQCPVRKETQSKHQLS